MRRADLRSRTCADARERGCARVRQRADVRGCARMWMCADARGCARMCVRTRIPKVQCQSTDATKLHFTRFSLVLAKRRDVMRSFNRAM